MASIEQSNGNKRRRTSQCTPCIHDIPEILLVKISGYLAKPSRAIFAVALTTDSPSWKKINWNQTPLLSWLTAANPKKQPCDASRAIVASTKWDTLDLTDVELQLAWRLCDDDVGAVLSSINAVEHLRKLELPGCVNITGRGLEPLHGSVVLERIDLELIGWHVKVVPLLCERIVLPILDTILGTPGNSLKYIDLPRKFRNFRSEVECTRENWTRNTNMDEFAARYKRHLIDREFQCTKCNNILVDPSSFSNRYDTDLDHIKEIQSHACSECLKYYCNEETTSACDREVTDCIDCDKRTCSACVPLTKYNCCSETACQKCRKVVKCNICQDDVCERCYVTCKYCSREGCWGCLNYKKCEDCDKGHCNGCFEEGTDRDVKACDWDHERCSSCRFSKCSENWNDAYQCCLDAIGISRAVASKLQEEKNKSEKEITSITEENTRLSEENIRLNVENATLQSKIWRLRSIIME